MAIGGRPQLLTTWPSPSGLRLVTTRDLTFSRASGLRQNKEEVAKPFMSSLGHHAPLFLPHSICQKRVTKFSSQFKWMRIIKGEGTKEYLDVFFNHHSCHLQLEVAIWGPGLFIGLLLTDSTCGLFKREVSQRDIFQFLLRRYKPDSQVQGVRWDKCLGWSHHSVLRLCILCFNLYFSSCGFRSWFVGSLQWGIPLFFPSLWAPFPYVQVTAVLSSSQKPDQSQALYWWLRAPAVSQNTIDKFRSQQVDSSTALI